MRRRHFFKTLGAASAVSLVVPPEMLRSMTSGVMPVAMVVSIVGGKIVAEFTNPNDFPIDVHGFTMQSHGGIVGVPPWDGAGVAQEHHDKASHIIQAVAYDAKDWTPIDVAGRFEASNYNFPAKVKLR